MNLELKSWPRHKLRVSGYSHASSDSGNGQADYRRLLNFLSKSSGIQEKAILRSSGVPEFAAVRQIFNQRSNRSGSSNAGLAARQALIGAIADMVEDRLEPNGLSESELLCKALCELLEQVDSSQASQAGQISELPGPVTITPFGPVDFPVADEKITYDAVMQNSSFVLDSSTVMPSRRPAAEPEGTVLDRAARMLDNWFNAQEDDSCDDAVNEIDARSLAGRYRTSMANQNLEQPASLLNNLEQIAQSASLADGKALPTSKTGPDDSSGFCNSVVSSSVVSSSVVQPGRRTSNKRRRQWSRPCLIPMNNGTRKEVFPNNASVTKDALGRVKEIRSPEGIRIHCAYDQNGHLISYVRTSPQGEVHSEAEKDRHGVIVRDGQGRVKAQGDNISVDPRGCVSIRKLDGQFWCVDLVRGIHIERRILEDLNGSWHSLTALLAYDGFRMVTRFQELNQGYRRYGDWLAPFKTGVFRFYGRDGSMIQFDCDEDLRTLRPSRVQSAGSHAVDNELKAKRQARTAWDAAHEYTSHYLSTL
ncbi:MAG: hypothetical protein K8F91_17730 [Candidatus Obscuribacterales bacterium]|nr:hypothetical protein [Candidatus Obscuribacterales bacterium]